MPNLKPDEASARSDVRNAQGLKPPRPGKKSDVTEAMDEAAVKEKLLKARGRIGSPTEETPSAETEEPEAEAIPLTKKSQKHALKPPTKIFEEAKKDVVGRALLEQVMKESEGMTMERAKKLVPNAERIRGVLSVRLQTVDDPSMRRAVSALKRRFIGNEDIASNYVLLLAKYVEAEQAGDAGRADELLVDVYKLGEMFKLMPMVQKAIEAARKRLPSEAKTLSEESFAQRKLAVSVPGEEEMAPESGERETHAIPSVPEPYTATFTPVTGLVKEHVERETKEYFEDQERHAREVLGTNYSLIGRVNLLISEHPEAIPMLDKERERSGYQSSRAEAFMLAMAEFVDARDRNDIDAANRLEASIRKLADAIGLTRNEQKAQFESAMAQPVNLKKAVEDVRRRQAGVNNQQRRWREAI